MTSSLHQELTDLKVNLLKMGSMVEEALQNAVVFRPSLAVDDDGISTAIESRHDCEAASVVRL